MCGYSFGPHQVYGTKSQEGSIDRKAGADAANGITKASFYIKVGKRPGWQFAQNTASDLQAQEVVFLPLLFELRTKKQLTGCRSLMTSK